MTQLTGSAKKDFEKWFTKDIEDFENYDQYLLNEFYKLGFSLQFGTYIDFFDDLVNDSKMTCRMCVEISETQKGFRYLVNGSSSGTFKDRKEARKKAIIYVNKIYNNFSL